MQEKGSVLVRRSNVRPYDGTIRFSRRNGVIKTENAGIQIGHRRIGGHHQAYIIAEACDNHFGSLSRAKEMAHLARLAGADAVKFQHHLPDEEMLPDVPVSDNFDAPLYEFLQKNALGTEDHWELKSYCESIGIQYLCTPFSFKAARDLEAMGVEAFKIGSGEMTDIPSLERIAAFGKPMIVSTGMCTPEEIERTYNTLRKRVPLVLMNCVSEYPPVYEDINLGFIQTMTGQFPEAVIGHSDHTPDLVTCFAAVALGAKLIEKHVTLDKRHLGPDQAVSIDFSELHDLVQGIRKIEAACGSAKYVHEKEQKIREWAYRSVVSLVEIPEGAVVTQEMVWSKRPGTGIPSHEMERVVGSRATRCIGANEIISWHDIEETSL